MLTGDGAVSSSGRQLGRRGRHVRVSGRGARRPLHLAPLQSTANLWGPKGDSQLFFAKTSRALSHSKEGKFEDWKARNGVGLCLWPGPPRLLAGQLLLRFAARLLPLLPEYFSPPANTSMPHSLSGKQTKVWSRVQNFLYNFYIIFIADFDLIELCWFLRI